jgi:radical SAM superfamily enzyme YgiQ (UPF0313 family)
MKVAIISTYTHPTRERLKEPSVMQSTVPELLAGLLPEHVEVEVFNEKETDIPLDRDWDLVFFSYLHAYYEHTKVLSTLLRRRGVVTVAGGRHAGHFTADALQHFDAVVRGEPEANVPQLIADFERGDLRRIYDAESPGPSAIKPARYDLIDFSRNRVRFPAIEASRGCPFRCNFCVLTGHERYRTRPVADVVDEIQTKLAWNRRNFGVLEDTFMFYDNNLGGSPKYLRELCEALIPLNKTWGCALTFNILRDPELVKLMARAGCRYVYTGLESLNPESIASMNKGQNKLGDVKEVMNRAYANGIILSFGLIVGSDGDTNDYLSRLPEYLSELGSFSLTFLGIVCPYPETPLYAQLAGEGRLLPGTISRDYDGYTLCHRPKNLAPSEVIEHYVRLAHELSALPNIVRLFGHRALASDVRGYKRGLAFVAPELRSIANPVKNTTRKYIAGQDPIEAWDADMMSKLELAPQYLS